MLMHDGLQSLATRLGTEESKVETASYSFTALDHHQLSAAFRSSWVIKKAVKLPPFDATRKWREWSGDRAEDMVEAERLSAYRVRKKVYDALWKSRLYGGAAILIGLADGQLSDPIDLDSVGQGDLRYLTVLSCAELMSGDIETDPREERYGKPRYYRITTGTGASLRVDPSRLVIFEGEPTPVTSIAGYGHAGWGDSVLQAIYDTCRNLDSTMANIASLVFDAKTDVIRLPNLSARITDPQFEQAVLKRFATARMLKGNSGILLLDAEEEYESKSYSFGGLDSIADRFMQVCSGATDIPMTRLLGMSPAGLNSTGESDQNNYYDSVGSMQTVEIEPEMKLLDECLIRSTLGSRPDDLSFSWRPLRQMTEKEISDLRNKNADTVSKLASSNVLDDEYVSEAGVQMLSETGIKQPDLDAELDG